jgi:hypothetical protein
MRNYVGVTPASIDDPQTRDAIYRIHGYLQQLNRVVGPKSTSSQSGTYAASKVGGWDTPQTLAAGNLDLTKVISRSIFLSPSQFAGASIQTGGTGTDIYQYIAFPSTTTTTVTTTFSVEEPNKTGQKVDVTGLYLWWSGGSSTAPAVFQLRYYTWFNQFSQANTPPNEPASWGNEMIVEPNGLGFMETRGDIPAFYLDEPGQPIRFVIQRDPAAAADTNPDAVQFLGAQVTYTVTLD